MKKIIKENSKLILGFILGGLMFGGLTGLFAYALNANEVSFTPTDTNWKVNDTTVGDVKTALDDLYTKAKPIPNTDASNLIRTTMADASLGERSDFSVSYSNNGTYTYYTAGIYETNNTEDGSTVYYYSGNVTNNWVRFGGNSSTNTCYYWRIIRTNTQAEGGGVRLLYSGESSSCSGAVPAMTDSYIDQTLYHYATSDGQNNNSSYVGYMYTLGEQFGHSTDSYAKDRIDRWYEKGLINYSSLLNNDAIYCGDRSTTYQHAATDNAHSWYATGSDAFSYDTVWRTGYEFSKHDGSNSWSSYHGETFGPTLKCRNAEDRYSKGNSAGGNGYLTYPIAMMTFDEIVYAGGRFWGNSYSWYYYNSNNESMVGDKLWWTMSPVMWHGTLVRMFTVVGSGLPGYLDNTNVSFEAGLRPVISTNASATWSGNGTVASPYTVS